MKDVYKNRITLNLGKVHTKMSFNTTQNNVLNFGLICTHTDTHTYTHKLVGEKRTMLQEIKLFMS